jgi:hypothetical protein
MKSNSELFALGGWWFDQGKPWAVFTVEDLVYNVNVQETIRQKGQ